MSVNTYQLKQWTGKFGSDYTKRNYLDVKSNDDKSRRQLGKTQSQIFKHLLRSIKTTSILEVGCNIGNQLAVLQTLGTYKLAGVEPQKNALAIAKKRLPRVVFKPGTIFNIPNPDNSFDLVFTSGVLIHIHPDNLPLAFKEIYRVSKKYIGGIEYYAKKTTQVTYRKHKNLLWKSNYRNKYLQQFPDLKPVKSQLLEFNKSVYGRQGLFVNNFVLEKS